ncbi:MAG TPA: hypothetical protein PLK67_02120 [Bryobacteraceae bacterium]|nr:hypothetical protein [Bryobacteraceae bacterium]HOL71250.1 hypothetical protein [Bryobacteraceae bacterium]
MDLYKAIRALYDEKKRLDKLIESLEELHARDSRTEGPAVRSRRGRKKMSEAERLEVSERMKKYWAARRAQALASSPEQTGGPAPALTQEIQPLSQQQQQ